MRKLYLMQGVPGSGKSTVAARIKAGAWEETDKEPIILSTDDWRYGDCGHYVFDPVTNVEFHMACQRTCVDAMRLGIETIIIDNTNIEKWQAEPYFCLARMYGYEINVIRVDPGLAEAKRRNAQRPLERRVPDEVIESMYSKMETLL